MLDNLPKSSWFLCLPIGWGVFFIAVLGVLHPLGWIRVMRSYRSEMFVFMYIIIYIWAALSIMLLYAILAESACIYTFWCYYTLAFGVTMVCVMCLIFAGFCVLGKKRNSVFAMLAFIYYCVTLYFVLVVNTRRREIFGLQARDCGDDSCKNSIQLKATGNTTATTGTATPSKKRHTTKSKKTQTVKKTQPVQITQPVKKQTKTKKPKVLRKAASMTQQATEPEIEDEMETTTPSETTETTPSEMMETTTPGDMAETTTSDTTETTTSSKMTTSSETMKTKQSRSTDPVKKTEKKKKLGSRKAVKTGLLSTEESQMKEPPPYFDLDPVRDPEDLDFEPRAKEDRLPEITSDACQMPRKPAHGRYEVRWGRSTMRLRLRCKKGYRENSVATECKYNWWDRPIPQCRKRRDAAPMDPDGGCVMPRYPPHGQYTVVAEPGEKVGGNKVVLQVKCDEPYRAVDPFVVCEGGQWRHAPPSCQKHCKLTFHPTVEYKCLKPFKDKFMSCNAWQPNGATVAAACRPGHAHRGPFKYMRCRGSTWNHEVACRANANFTI